MIRFEEGKQYFGGVFRRDAKSGNVEYDELLCISRDNSAGPRTAALLMKTIHLAQPAPWDTDGKVDLYIAFADDEGVEHFDYRSTSISATDIVPHDPEIADAVMRRKFNKWLGKKIQGIVEARYPLDEDSEAIVKFTFSESTYLDCSVKNPIELSLNAADSFIKILECLFSVEDGMGYDKTDITIEYKPKEGELSSYSLRYDIGADAGSLLGHIEQYWDSDAIKQFHERFDTSIDISSGNFWVDLLRHYIKY